MQVSLARSKGKAPWYNGGSAHATILRVQASGDGFRRPLAGGLAVNLSWVQIVRLGFVQ